VLLGRSRVLKIWTLCCALPLISAGLFMMPTGLPLTQTLPSPFPATHRRYSVASLLLALTLQQALMELHLPYTWRRTQAQDILCVCMCVYMILSFELRASYLLSKRSNTSAIPQPFLL
jgi:hypothetical protein